jgi:hypothetical protein
MYTEDTIFTIIDDSLRQFHLSSIPNETKEVTFAELKELGLPEQDVVQLVANKRLEIKNSNSSYKPAKLSD